jgi:hypothetical protein
MEDSIKQEIWTSIKVIVLGLFIASIFEILISTFILTILTFINSNISTFLNIPVYFDVMIYSAISISGIYVGISKAKNKFLLAAIIGLLCYPVRNLMYMILGSYGHFNFNLINIAFNFLKYGFICVMFTWLSNMIFLKIKKNNNSLRIINE